MAKRDIEQGETLEAIGETSYRGYALERVWAAERNVLPIGLAHGARVRERIPKGTLITRAQAEADPASPSPPSARSRTRW